MKWWRIIFWVIIAIVIILTVFLIIASPKVKADENAGTNISFGQYDHFSWNKIFGWADFHETHSIMVYGDGLTGYANSSIGDVSLDCATTRNGDVCEASNYGVKNDGGGNLSGYGWNQTIGWISFYCDQTAYGGPNVCGAPNYSNYRVTINTASGDFNGFGWNPIVGWVSFNCANPPGVCGDEGSNYKVNTSWRSQAALGFLESSIFDTDAPTGVILNSIIWHGDQPAGTHVKFQIAVSNNPDGPWDYKGPDEDQNQYFEGSGPGVPIIISGGDRAWVNNQRYLRYKVFLESDVSQTESPIVEDVILNWSR